MDWRLVLFALLAVALASAWTAQAHEDDEDEDYELDDSEEEEYSSASAKKPAQSPPVQVPQQPPQQKDEKKTVSESVDDEEHSDFYPGDDEEFEGDLPRPAQAAAAGEASTAAPTTTTTAAPAQPFDWRNFRMEMLLVAGLIAYGINYLTGGRKNEAIAKAWGEACKPIMADNFGFVNTKGCPIFIRESNSDFVLYGTGRRNCRSLSAYLQLSPRHDLVSVTMKPFMPSPDRLTIMLDLLPNSMEPFVLAVVPRKKEKKMRAEYEDLDFFTKTYNGESYGLPSGLMVMTDNPDAATTLLSEDIVKVLDKYQDCLHYLYITDQYLSTPSSEDGDTPTAPAVGKVMFLKFNIPSDHLTSCKLQQLALRMSIVLLDTLSDVHLTTAAAAQASKKRAEFAERQQKKIQKDLMAKAQEKKEAKKREERERAAAQGPEDLHRWEEQQRKEQEKKKLRDRQRTMLVRKM